MSDYPFDPEVQAEMLARGEQIPPPPQPPAMPPPGPGGQMPAARITDMTMHFGTITAPTGPRTVLIGGLPAACMGDVHVCPMFDGPKPHVGGTIAKGSATVTINMKPAARVNDPCICMGPPNMVAPPACPTVLIGG